MAAVETPTTRAGSARTISPASYVRVVWFAAAMLAGIIFTGAAVRLTQSGLGCEDWPRCSQDRMVPEWSFHAWIEFGNRLLSGVVSAAVVAAVLTAYRRNPRRPDLIRWSWGLVAGVMAQILLGGATVLADLHPLFVSAHFLLSIVLMWNVLVLAAKAKGSAAARPSVPGRTLTTSRVMVGLAASVLVIGTLVTGSGPHGGDTRADRLGFDLTQIARVHSTSAWFLVAATLLLAWSLRPLGGPGAGARQANLTRLLVALVIQGAIGYWQFATGIPPALVELHVMGAVAVWSTALWMHLGLFDRGPLDIAVEGTRS